MKLTKTQLKKFIKEELKKANHIAKEVLNEDNIFKNSNRLLPSEWNEFKERFLRDNKNHKVVSGKTKYGDKFEAIVKKSRPDEAVVKYLFDEMSVKHDMKAARFFDYLR